MYSLISGLSQQMCRNYWGVPLPPPQCNDKAFYNQIWLLLMCTLCAAACKLCVLCVFLCVHKYGYAWMCIWYFTFSVAFFWEVVISGRHTQHLCDTYAYAFNAYCKCMWTCICYMHVKANWCVCVCVSVCLCVCRVCNRETRISTSIDRAWSSGQNFSAGAYQVYI